MEKYIPYSLICDLFSKNSETFLYLLILKEREISLPVYGEHAFSIATFDVKNKILIILWVFLN